MRKSISMNVLSLTSIADAVRELEDMKHDLDWKINELVNRVAQELATMIQQNFMGTLSENAKSKDGAVSLSESPTYTIDIQDRGNASIVFVSGQDAIFVEFGTGVYYNGKRAGSSLHPKGVELGFTIGSYGLGRGKQKTWYFQKDGAVYRTHGVPAKMPMYKAAQDVAKEIERIAREVFG